MSCGCGAERIEDCASLAELADVAGGVDWSKLHRAMWCLLHPTQCRRDPRTGRPRLALDDLAVLGFVFFAWHTLTRDG